MSKRMNEINSSVTVRSGYSPVEAFKALKSASKVKFNESIEVAVQLGIDAKKSDQTVRGASSLPHGTGKTVRVAVFTQGDKVEAAKAAGADVVGLEDLAEDIKANRIALDFDVVIASPDAMPVIGKLGQILGPKGLMPNPKVGTVAVDVAKAVQVAKAGQVRFRNDKAGIIHCSIGKVDFDPKHLTENLQVLLEDLNKIKPSQSKGTYIKKVSVSSTMGPGLKLDTTKISE